VIWSLKRIIDEVVKISQLETKLRERALMWYIKYKANVTAGKERSLEEIKRYLIKKF
jgi:hypothetical protein